MARTIFEIATEVCDRVTVASPDSLFGNNDRIARTLRVAAKDTIRDMMRSAMKNGMSSLQSQWVFATKPKVYAYSLPPDFFKMLPHTEQRNRWPLGIIGPANPQTWSNWIGGAAYTAVPMAWRIANNLIHLEPPPTETELVLIEYLSRYPVARDATDADLAPVDGRLAPISPLVPREGYIAAGALDAVPTSGASKWGEATWGTAVWGSTPAQELRRVPTGAANTRFPAYQVRAEEFTADTDRSAFDDDHVLSLGLTWRLRKGLRMPYAEAHEEYEEEKGVFLANDASRGRTIVFGDDVPHEGVVPLGGDRWLVS